MKYQVTLFNTGYPVVRVEANTSTPKQAANFAIGKHGGAFEHARVVGKKVFRFNKKLQPIKGEMRVYKTQVGTTPALLLMIGKYPEFFRFKNKKARDDTYERVSECITSPFAESVENDPAQTDITASSEGTSVSSSSMFLKTSSGSAESVTLLDLLTLSTIEKSFGKGSVEDTDTATWSTGWKASPSEPKPQTLWATVLPLPDPACAPSPGTNESMLELVGTTIEVTRKGALYKSKYYFFKPEWLDFDNIIAKIVNKEPAELTFLPAMRRFLGKTTYMEICKSSGDNPHYTAFDFCWDKKWLEIGWKMGRHSDTVTAEVKDIDPGTKSKGIVFVPPMSKYVGKTMTFVPHDTKSGVYTAEGWHFAKNWLKFEDSTEKLKNDTERAVMPSLATLMEQLQG